MKLIHKEGKWLVQSHTALDPEFGPSCLGPGSMFSTRRPCWHSALDGGWLPERPSRKFGILTPSPSNFSRDGRRVESGVNNQSCLCKEASIKTPTVQFWGCFHPHQCMHARRVRCLISRGTETPALQTLLNLALCIYLVVHLCPLS